jgi:hypothetical protein
VGRAKKKKGRAAGFLLLAGLALLIAGFIARREIPILIKEAGHSPAAAAHADIGGISDGEKLQPPAEPRLYAGSSDSSAGVERSASPAANVVHDTNQENQSGEHLSDTERRQLDNVIKEKSR